MPKTYFDDRGRRFSDEQIVRDYLGRNRERAMQMLGMATREAPAPVNLAFEEVEVDGEIRVRAIQVDPSRDE